MADLLLTVLLGWYGFGLLAALVLLGTQLVGRVRHGSREREREAAGRPDRAEPVRPDAPPAPVAGVRPAGRR